MIVHLLSRFYSFKIYFSSKRWSKLPVPRYTVSCVNQISGNCQVHNGKGSKYLFLDIIFLLAFKGTVEARVMCFYRRADIPPSLIVLADKHHWGEADPEQVPVLLQLFEDRTYSDNSYN